LVEKDVQRVKPETALVIAVSAAVVGQILGGLLTLFGGWVNDYFAGKRVERQQTYEDHKREEQQKREDQLRVRSEWSRACKGFMAATTITQPLMESARQEHHRALNEAYVEARLYGSGMQLNAIRGLYKAAAEAIDTEEEDAAVWDRLQQHRDHFMERAREHLDQE
jgi:hypothetical protein